MASCETNQKKKKKKCFNNYFSQTFKHSILEMFSNKIKVIES